MGFAFEFDPNNNILRGSIKDSPKMLQLSDEIMKLLINRQTSLADGSYALTKVMINTLKANYSGARADEFNLFLSHYFEEVGNLLASMTSYRFCHMSWKKVAEWVERDRVIMDEQTRRELRRRSSFSVKRLWHRIQQVTARAGTTLQNKLGHGGDSQDARVARAESVRKLFMEICDLLNKRGPNLADGLNALNTVLLTAIEASQGREKANEYDLLNAWFYKEVRTFTGGRVQ